MANWFQDWFGPQPEGGGGRIPAMAGLQLGVPVFTQLINVLTDELDDVDVWADADRSDTGRDSVVVMATGGESLTTSTSWVQMYRTFRLIVTSDTSDRAETLMDEVAIIIKRRRDAFNFVTANVLPGGYDFETETYQRGFEVTFRGRK